LIVIGVGNAWRGDDGAGLAVARRLREAAPAGLEVREVEGDASVLVDAWAGADRVVVVDAAESGAPPGSVRRFDAVAEPLPARGVRSSTHAFGVPDAIELSRALGRLPTRLDVYAIEGERFEAGERLTPEVERAVGELVEELRSAVLRPAIRLPADRPRRFGAARRPGGDARSC
jgi:hydrogenase maturation protease